MTQESCPQPFSFMSRRAPAGVALRLVSIPAHAELAYESSHWAEALVVVEAGEIELECAGGMRAAFGPNSVLFFDGIGLRTIRNLGNETVLLSAASRRVTGRTAKETSDSLPTQEIRP